MGLADFGVEFDLSLNNSTSLTSQDVGAHDSDANLHFVVTQGEFGELIGSKFGDALTAASDSDVHGGLGSDELFVNGNTSNVTLAGGADDDVLTISGSDIANIDFTGDDGTDILLNEGAIDGLIFSGGADDDALENNGTISSLQFEGGADTDLLDNYGTIGDVQFGGGADADELYNEGIITGTLNFSGDDGADALYNDGEVNTLVFSGGADDDVLYQEGTIVTSLNFNGDDGSDLLENTGTIVGLTFGGGADDDVLMNATSGELMGINFAGDDGADTLTNDGMISGLVFSGGADDDVLTNNDNATIDGLNFGGDDGADLLENNGSLTGTLVFSGGADSDILTNSGSATSIDFGGDDGRDLLTNSGTIESLDFSGGADQDFLQNQSGGIIDVLDFTGDQGADSLTNSGSIGSVTFGGGADQDILLNDTDGVFGSIDFTGDDGADILQNDGTVSGAVTFGGGADDDTLINAGSMLDVVFSGGADDDALLNDAGATMQSLDFTGDDGADLLVNRGQATSLVFGGGADDDVLTNVGSATTINFGGDDGADTLNNTGSATTITFSGGADDDVLRNTSTASVSQIDFTGDAGADVLVSESATDGITFSGGADDDALVNRAATDSLVFSGGADNDVLLNTGSDVAVINFGGDDGADLLQSTGDRVGSIVFTGDDGADVLIAAGDGLVSVDFSGGADDDVLISRATNVTAIDFSGDDDATQNGADTMIISGSGVLGSTVVFTGFGGKDALQNNATGFSSIAFGGGADDDVFQNNATVGAIDFTGDDGADVLDNNGAGVGQIAFRGGADVDILLNDGAEVAMIDFSGGADDDVLLNVGDRVGGIDFGGDDGADTLINRGFGVENIDFNGGADDDVLVNEGAAASGIVFAGDAGNDRFYIQASGLGSNGLEFFGDAGEDLLVNRAGYVSGITFHGGADDDVLRNEGVGVSGIDFSGDDGADTLVNSGNQVAEVLFSGGADDDVLFNSGNAVVDIMFTGDDGDDILQNNGSSVEMIVFNGGADDDILVNNGTDVGSINFTGDAGSDILQNNGAELGALVFTGGADSDTLQNNGGDVVSVTFTGGADADSLINNGDQIGSINFTGDGGSDSLVSRGNSVSAIVFSGGADADVISVSGNQVGSVSVTGGSGADSFVFDGSGGSVVTFVGSDGNDLVAWLGAGGGQFDFAGDEGSDTVILRGGGDITIAGGNGDDYVLFQGDPTANVTIVESFGGASDDSRDTLDFSAFSGGPLNLDLRSTSPQWQSSNLLLTLSDGMGVENVYGTSGGDTIQGNARDNVINGAEYLEPVVGPVAGQRTESQWVWLDFDSATTLGEGEHVYTISERDEIQSLVQTSYHGPDSDLADPTTWWFNVQFTQDLNVIAAALGYNSTSELSSDEFATILFNETPSFGRPGGEASEVDLGNLNLGGTAFVQVNGLLGGQQSASDVKEILADTEEGAIKIGARKPIATSGNFVALAAKIAAHELGHLMGLRHYDTFGPVGFGINSTPGGDEFNPNYTGPAGAFEAVDHLLGSGASIGTDRFNDLRGLFFGERESVKLALANSDPTDVIATETADGHHSIETAQPLDAVTLIVPNTLASGLNSIKQFSVQAASVLGQLGLNDQGVSESDFYSFVGRRGELVNIELSSQTLRGNRASSDLYFDSIVKVYDGNGQLVSWYGSDAVNDDEFESSDSVIIDLILPSDGEYFIEVDSFSRLPGAPGFEEAVALRAELESRNDLTDAETEFLSRLQDTLDDTDVGTYQLFMYRFAQGNAFDDIDGLKGNGGHDIINGGVGDDFSTVLDLGAAISTDSGVALERTIVFGDRAASNWTATVDYGDGSGSQTLDVTVNGDGLPSFVLTHTYPDNGDFTLLVAVTNDIGGTTERTLSVVVADVAPVVAFDSILTIDGETEFVEGTALAVIASAADPSGASRSFVFNYEVFKDGSATAFASQTGADLTRFEFTPDNNGVYEIRLSVADEDGDVSVVSTEIEVANVNPMIVSPVVPNRADEGELLTFSATATDAGDAELVFSWNIDGTINEGETVQYQFIDGDADGTAYSVVLTVVDPDGGSATESFIVTVDNVAPIIENSNVPLTAIVTTPVEFSADASDAGINDELSFVWDFGDGSVSEIGAVTAHTYSFAGEFITTLTVTDSDGLRQLRLTQSLSAMMQKPDQRSIRLVVRPMLSRDKW